jgi:hypothetical protein
VSVPFQRWRARGNSSLAYLLLVACNNLPACIW